MKKYLNIEFSWSDFDPTEVITEENLNEIGKISENFLKLELKEDHGVFRLVVGEVDTEITPAFISSLMSTSALISIGVATTRYLHHNPTYDTADTILAIQSSFTNLGAWFADNARYPYGKLPFEKVAYEEHENDSNFYLKFYFSEDM